MKNLTALTSLKPLLAEKRDHLEAIWEITCHQADVLERDDVDELLLSLDNRQAHVDAIGEIERAMPDRTLLRQDRESVQMAIACNQLLERILQQDALNQQKASDRLVFLKRQTRRLSQGRRTAQYDPIPTGVGAAYFDHRR
ncbi:MAG: hypothetical protein LBF64_05255 [Oscillospiraceae bacterium]|jgi:hypothetical protein|nr:hypothetical protein [Oscillospiraceae bacterium]